MSIPPQPESGLIADMRNVIEQVMPFDSAWELDDYNGEEMHRRIKSALAALPPDAVIVPAALLTEAADMINDDANRICERDGFPHGHHSIADRLRTAAEGGSPK